LPTAFVLVNTEPAWMDQVLKKVMAVEGVKEAAMVYGIYDIVVKVETDTMYKLKTIINDHIRKIHKVKATTTMVVLKAE
jgi:Lrp/AsnC family transcriptional regulator for asnA, asnC and gidA